MIAVSDPGGFHDSGLSLGCFFMIGVSDQFFFLFFLITAVSDPGVFFMITVSLQGVFP